jgi:hypothetical protein
VLRTVYGRAGERVAERRGAAAMKARLREKMAALTHE